MNGPTHSRLWLEGGAPSVVRESAGGGVDNCAVVLAKSPSRTADDSCEDVAGLFRWDDRCTAIVVADGLGGHGDGDFAARLTLRCIADRVAASEGTVESIQSAILTGIDAANQQLLERPGGAATTVLAAVIEGERFRSYHAGDSELLITGQRGKIKHQTVSHSPVGYAVESGLLDADAGLVHEDRHVISNFVGMAGMRVEIASAIRLALRDTVVLASDGLWDNVHVDEVTEVVRKGPLLRAADRLVERCVERMQSTGGIGKPDDLAIALFRRR